jgi:capsular exopolysaccharide synthesis family protein
MTNQRLTYRDIGKPLAVGPTLPKVIWRYRWLVLGCVMASSTIAMIYLALTRPLYLSTESIYVEQVGPRITDDQPLALINPTNFLYNQIEFIRSRPVLEKAIKICKDTGILSTADPNEAMDLFRSGLEVTAGRRDDIIRINFAGPDPVQNAMVANAVVRSYIALRQEQGSRTYGEILRILNREKAVKEEMLSNYKRTLEDLAHQYPQLTLPAEMGRSLMTKLDAISSALTDASLTALEARLLYEAAQKVRDDPDGLLMILRSKIPAGQDTETEIARLKARIEQMQLNRKQRLQVVTEEHPIVKAIDAEIAQASEQLKLLEDKLVARVLFILEQQYLSAQRRKEELDVRFEQAYQQLAQLNKAIGQYAQVQSEYQQEKGLLEQLEKRISQISLLADAGALNISVLEDAQPATRPYKPRPAKVFAIAIVLGAAVGCSLAVLLQTNDKRIRDPALIRALVPYPVLGQVPVISGRPSSQAQKVLEAFRAIRTALLFALPEDRSRIIQVVSTIPGEGASTTASCLAVSLARTGQRVLVIDVDLQHPSQHQILGVDGRLGLSTVLMRKGRLAEAIACTGMSRLHLLPAGAEAAGCGELLHGRPFRQLLQILARHYEWVILDSPPITHNADAQIIAAVSQVTMLVIRPDFCTYHALGQSLDCLARYPDKQITVVINAVDSRKLSGWLMQTNPNGKCKGRLLATAIGSYAGRSQRVSGYTRITS